MRAQRTFRIVWRINAVLILIAGVLAVALLLFGGIALWNASKLPRRSYDAQVVVQGERFYLGSFERFEGVSRMRAPLRSEVTHDGKAFSSGGDDAAVRNYLFLDPATLDSVWLFPSNGQVILESTDLTFPDRREWPQSGPLRGTVLLVVDKDDNGDGKLNGDDHMALLLVSPDGTRTTTIVPEITRYNGQEVMSASEALIFFSQQDSLQIASIDLTTFAVRWVKPLQPREGTPKK